MDSCGQTENLKYKTYNFHIYIKLASVCFKSLQLFISVPYVMLCIAIVSIMGRVTTLSRRLAVKLGLAFLVNYQPEVAILITPLLIEPLCTLFYPGCKIIESITILGVSKIPGPGFEEISSGMEDFSKIFRLYSFYSFKILTVTILLGVYSLALQKVSLKIRNRAVAFKPEVILLKNNDVRLSSIEAYFQNYLLQPLDIAFIGLWIALTISSIPYIIMLIYPSLFSWYVILFVRTLSANLGNRAENFLHWELHLKFLRRLKAGTNWFPRLVFCLCFQIAQFGWGPLFGYIPNTYYPTHVFIHHIEDNDIADTQTTLLYDRCSLFDFSLCALRKLWDITTCAGPIEYLVSRGRYRELRLLLIPQLQSIVVLGILIHYNTKATCAIYLFTFFMKGYSSARGIWNWHAFIDDTDPKNCVKNSVVQIMPHLGGPFNGLFHSEHHRFGGLHWSKLIKSFVTHLPEYVKERGLIFKYDERMFFLLLRQDFSTIAKEIYVNLDKKNNSLQDIENMLIQRARPPNCRDPNYQLSILEQSLINLIPLAFGNMFSKPIDFNAHREIDIMCRLHMPERENVFAYFRKYAIQSPDEVVYYSGVSNYTYSQILAMAKKINSRLLILFKDLKLGSNGSLIVGICAQRSVEFVAAVLGVWMAGAAYVPIDSDLPQSRMQYMLTDTSSRILLVGDQSSSFGWFDGTVEYITAILDEEYEPDMSEWQPPFPMPALAYVMYTSGSSGKPKGVMGTHAGILNRLHWMWREFPFTSDERCSHIKSISTVGMLWELFGPLLGGVPLFVLPNETVMDTRQLLEAIELHRITRIVIVPSQLSVISSYLKSNGGGKYMRYLKYCTSSGETLSPELAATFMGLAPNVKLINLYGPTETASDATYFEVYELISESTRVPIGSPIDNTSIMILDESLQPVADGAPGEICVAGSGLALGYWNQPELTQHCFVEISVPLDQTSEELEVTVEKCRVYRTGDLGRKLADGTYEYIGRIDNQVKVRGFRVELEEVEAALRSHASVMGVVVRPRFMADGDCVLEALIVKEEEASEDSVTAVSLLSHVSQQLPSFMVPSRFGLLEAMPKLTSGKIDRARCKDSSLQVSWLTSCRQTDVESSFADLSGTQRDLETTICGIFQRVLQQDGLPQGTDDFFLLGGNSIAAARTMVAIEREVNIALNVVQLFKHRSARELALLISSINADPSHIQEVVAPIRQAKSKEGPHPTSFGQDRLWFLDRVNPNSGLYNVPFSMFLHGHIDVAALRSALNRLMVRHSVLRATFNQDNEDHELVQDFDKVEAVFPLQELDLRMLDETERNAVLQRNLRKETTEPFSLSVGPLIRGQLLILKSDQYALIVCMHHTVCDGLSHGIFCKDVSDLYNNIVNGDTMKLAELQLQFSDFARWQKLELVGSAKLSTGLEYWQQTLAGIPVSHNLVTDRARRDSPTYRGGRVSFVLDANLVTKLRLLSKDIHGTLFTVLYAAFAALMSHYSCHADDVVIGTVSSGRSHAGLESLIGFFVTTVALRIRVFRGTTFQSLAETARDVILGALEHSDVPFERIVDRLRLNQGLEQHPVFQVAFFMQPEEPTRLDLQDVTCERIPIHGRMSKFDLTLHAVEFRDGEVKCNFEYSEDIFDRETIQQMAAAFERGLQKCSNDPGAAVDTMFRTYPTVHNTVVSTNESILSLFLMRVKEQPLSTAIIQRESTKTYSELLSMICKIASRVSHTSKNNNNNIISCSNPVLVGICAQRSVEFVAAVLGVWMAGAAYVPIDSDLPQSRMQYMLTDTSSRILLVGDQSSSFGWFDGTVEYITAILDEEYEPDMSEWQPPFPMPALAYVMYTSGSSGKPKGVMGTHAGILNRLHWMWREFPFTSDEVFAHTASFAFVDSLWMTFGPLLGGVPLVILENEVVKDVNQLLAAIEKYQITRIVAVPSLLSVLVAVCEVDESKSTSKMLDSLRLCVSSGEILIPAVARSCCNLLRNSTILNIYGSTEVAADASSYVVLGNKLLHARLPIGSPIDNTSIMILDESLQPVADGAPGEICVAGSGLALGYWNQPELTQRCFVEISIPLDQTSEELEVTVEKCRVYRTGDLGRKLADGTYEYIGRIDNQVKVRGFRVELEEVEAALRSHASVMEVVVRPRFMADGDCVLEALIVKEEEASEDSVTAVSLLSHVTQQLPSFMVPSRFGLLEAMPKLTSGKIDRARCKDSALQVSWLTSSRQTDVESSFADLSGTQRDLETTICGIFQRVLQQDGLPQGTDDFFLLGGNSIAAARTMVAIEREVNIALNVVQLFKHRSARELALLISSINADPSHIQEVVAPIRQAKSKEGPHPTSFGQDRLWFLDRVNPNSGLYNVPFSMFLHGHIDVAALRSALNRLMVRHSVLRATFNQDNEDHELVQDFDKVEAVFPLQELDLRMLDETERNAVLQRNLRQETTEPFSLSVGPLIRGQLLILKSDQYALIVCMHHTVCDGLSHGIFCKDVSDLYNNIVNGDTMKLAELQLQFSDFARWQKLELVGSTKLSTGLEYWQQTLAGIPVSHNLVTDRARRDSPTYRGGRVSFVLDANLVTKLRLLSKDIHGTLFTVLYAAFAALMSHYSCHADDVVIGTVSSGRSHAGLESLIGFFVTTVALRIRVFRGTTFQSLAETARDVILGALEHSDVPFERIVDRLRLNQGLEQHPVFQVAFFMQPEEPTRLDLQDVTCERIPIHGRMSKFDLTLHAVEFRDGEVKCNFEYSEDIFDRETIQQMAAAFERGLQKCSNDPGAAVDTMFRTYPTVHNTVVSTNESILSLFLMRVKEQPLSTAIIQRESTKTYSELLSMICKIASRVSHTCKNNNNNIISYSNPVLVGICAQRSVEFVAAVLGVWMAGAAYVPIDSDLPQSRMQYMLTDTSSRILLVGDQSSSFGWFDGTVEYITAILDEECEPDMSEWQPPFPMPALAYVMYTSGSSGKPKGVMGTHAGILNRLHWMWREFPFTSDEVCTLTCSLAYVDSLWMTFGPLLGGVPLVILENEVVKDVNQLLAAIEKYQITRIVAVPSLLSVLVAVCEVDESKSTSKMLDSLRLCVSLGEVLTPSLANACRQEIRNAAIVNMYGPTEVTADASFYLVRKAFSDSTRVPIGSPIDNTSIMILDESLQPVADGAPGEICVAGSGLALGYWNQPELTQLCFVEISIPLDQTSEELEVTVEKCRVYRTGDLGRKLADGTYDYIGRIDNQVKVRGFRVELEEVEAALRSHASVMEVVVRPRFMADGDCVLEALIVKEEEASEDSVTAVSLLSHVSQQLPSFMVPSRFGLLEAMPKLTSGKIDRARCKDSALQVSWLLFAENPHSMNMLSIEDELCSILREQLSLATVLPHDKIQSLGLSSLHSVVFASKIFSVYSVEVLRWLLNPFLTVSHLALLIQSLTEQLKVKESSGKMTSSNSVDISPLILREVELRESAELRRQPVSFISTSYVRLELTINAMKYAKSPARGSWLPECMRSSISISGQALGVINCHAGDSMGPPWKGVLDVHSKAIYQDVAPGRYLDNSREPELLSRLLHFFTETCKIREVGTKNIIISNSTMTILSDVCTSLLSFGDIVLTGNSFYHTHAGTVAICKGELLCIRTRPENSFKLTATDLESFRLSHEQKFLRCKAILLYNPGPKSGVLYSEKELQDIAQFGYRYRLLIISDEIFRFTTHDRSDQVISMAAVRGVYDDSGLEINMIDHCVTLFGPSKCYGCVGLRVGYGCLPQWLRHDESIRSSLLDLVEKRGINSILELAEQGKLNDARLVGVNQMRGFSYMFVSVPSQIAAAASFDTPDFWMLQNSVELRARVLLIESELIPKLNANINKQFKDGGFSIFVFKAASSKAAFSMLLDFNAFKNMIIPWSPEKKRIETSLDLFTVLNSYGVGLSPGFSVGFDDLTMTLSFGDVGHKFLKSEQSEMERNSAFMQGRELLRTAFDRMTEALIDLIIPLNAHMVTLSVSPALQSNFRLLDEDIDILQFVDELHRNDQYWDFDTSRQSEIRTQRETLSIKLVNQRLEVQPLAAIFPRLLEFVMKMATKMKGTVGVVTLAKLRPLGTIYPHSEGGGYYDEHDRFHLVLQSPRGAWVTSGEETALMLERQLWWFDNKKTHSVKNYSANSWRVHLIFDLSFSRFAEGKPIIQYPIAENSIPRPPQDRQLLPGTISYGWSNQPQLVQNWPLFCRLPTSGTLFVRHGAKALATNCLNPVSMADCFSQASKWGRNIVKPPIIMSGYNKICQDTARCLASVLLAKKDSGEDFECNNNLNFIDNNDEYEMASMESRKPNSMSVALQFATNSNGTCCGMFERAMSVRCAVSNMLKLRSNNSRLVIAVVSEAVILGILREANCYIGTGASSLRSVLVSYDRYALAKADGSNIVPISSLIFSFDPLSFLSNDDFQHSLQKLSSNGTSGKLIAELNVEKNMAAIYSLRDKVLSSFCKENRDDAILADGIRMILLSKNGSFYASNVGSMIAIISCSKWCQFSAASTTAAAAAGGSDVANDSSHMDDEYDAKERRGGSCLRGYAGQVWQVNEPLTCVNNTEVDVVLLYWKEERVSVAHRSSDLLTRVVESGRGFSSSRLDCLTLRSNTEKEAFIMTYQNVHHYNNETRDFFIDEQSESTNKSGPFESISFGRVLLRSREEDDSVVGYMQAHYDSLCNGIVISFGILGEFRSRGYAREAISASLSIIRSKVKEFEFDQNRLVIGHICARVVLSSKSSTTAKSMLLSMGFEWFRNRTVGALRDFNQESRRKTENDDDDLVSEYRTWIM